MALAAVIVLALPTSAAAGSTEEDGAVLEAIATSPKQALAFWTQARREQAEPLPIVTLPGSAAEAPAEATEEATPESESATPLAAGSRARTAALGGTEISSAASTEFPNSANGKVFGVFSFFPQVQMFECSGSVLTGNVVLTAGHCVIDPKTGDHALAVVFAAGYNDGETANPYGLVAATDYAFTKSWEQTAKPGSYANEGSDVAFLKLSSNLEKTVGGSLKISFDQPCNQLYTQYGYPGEEPYDGEVLYSHVAPYAGPDTNPNFSPTPMKIASDFTRGASGGPWTIGSSSSLTALSVTAYEYESQPGYLYGPYFGEAARKAYELASGKPVPIGIEETCRALPEIPVAPETAPTPTPPAPSAPIASPTPGAGLSLRLTRLRHRANGSAVLTAKVSAAGLLRLSGAAVRAESLDIPTAGRYRLVVAPKGKANRRLRQRGRTKVGVKVAFSASGKTKRISRKIQLSRRSGGRLVRQQASRFHSKVRPDGAERVPSARR